MCDDITMCFIIILLALVSLLKAAVKQHQPVMVAWMFCFSISRYLGLSGNQGSIISWMKVGITTTERNKGQCSSCGGDNTANIELQSVVCTAYVTIAHTANEMEKESIHLSKELVKAQDLRQEDTGADEDARDQTQEASQVLWRNLTQIHRHDTERDACSERSREEEML